LEYDDRSLVEVTATGEEDEDGEDGGFHGFLISDWGFFDIQFPLLGVFCLRFFVWEDELEFGFGAIAAEGDFIAEGSPKRLSWQSRKSCNALGSRGIPG
jgi:hypothetical protein